MGILNPKNGHFPHTKHMISMGCLGPTPIAKPDPKLIFVSGAGVTKSVEKGKRIISADESLRRKLIS